MLPLSIVFKSESETGPGASGHPIQESPHGLWATKKNVQNVPCGQGPVSSYLHVTLCFSSLHALQADLFHCFHPCEKKKCILEVSCCSRLSHLKLFLNLLQDSLRRLTLLATCSQHVVWDSSQWLTIHLQCVCGLQPLPTLNQQLHAVQTGLSSDKADKVQWISVDQEFQ